MFSIDQNSHPLWDALPKVQALRAKGFAVRHYVEDIDVAFTRVGADVEQAGAAEAGSDGAAHGGGALRLEREQFYRGGEADWGAALFYHQFLGRLPVDVRQWEPLTGRSTKAIAGRLGRTVEELYEEFSPSDNWQLIGPSYVKDGGHHRVIGDLSVAETGDFLRQVLGKAREDCAAAFPDPPCRQRTAEWFSREEALLDSLLSRHGEGTLADLYKDWMCSHLGGPAAVDLTSRLFAAAGPTGRFEALEVFLRDYSLAAGLYNEAVAEAAPYLRPLDTAAGELPFFAVFSHEGHMVRSAVFLEGGRIRINSREFALAPDRGTDAAGGRLPLADLAAVGVQALGGKAVLLVIQARLGEGGAALALPYRGSTYMPASHRLAGKLRAAGLLKGVLHPVIRVRLRLLDRLGELSASIRLPRHLADCFGKEVVPAKALGESWASLAEEARRRLEELAAPAGRSAWQRRAAPDIASELEGLDRRRRELARQDAKNPELRAIWKRMKPLELDMLRRTVHRIAADTQVREIDYWDSRGAILPWCVGLGGQEFYNDVIARAEIHEEEAH